MFLHQKKNKTLPTQHFYNQPTTYRSSVILQERFGKCQQHPQTQYHHRGCFPPAVRHPPRGDYLYDQEVFEGENEDFLREHHLLRRKRELKKKTIAKLRPRTCNVIALTLLPR